MKRGKWVAGYTIVEVMIVLAVSGLMFTVAANFINGKQPQASFKSGVSEMASRVQDTINQVNDGRYTDVNFDCKNVGGSLQISTGAVHGNGGASKQGANSDCVFIGKIIFFKQGATKSDYQVIPLAGARQNGGVPATLLTDVHPTPIVSNTGSGNVFSLISSMTVPQSLDVSKMKLLDAAGSPTTSVYAIGFIQGLGSLSGTAAGTGYSNGSQSINMVYVNGFSASSDGATAGLGANNLVYASGAVICLTDGTRNAYLKIGGQASQLTVQTKYYSGTAPAECN